MSHIIVTFWLSGLGARETARILAREKQEQLVQQKKNHVVRPIPGSLSKLRIERKQDRIKLRSFGNLKVSMCILGIK